MLVDYVIVGQGLAGTTLAWQLIEAGLRVLVIDRAETGTASQIAAGLMTPITGKRLVFSKDWHEFWPMAVEFYRRIELLTQSKLMVESPAFRWFQEEQERALFLRRQESGEYVGLDMQLLEPLADQFLNAPWGGFFMAPAGRLQVAEYLAASRRWLDERGRYLAIDLLPGEIQPAAQGIQIDALGVTAQGCIFCEGAAGVHNPWFQGIDFRLAKGEILTLEMPHWEGKETHHQSVWLAPWQVGQFRAGSTYEWQQLDQRPTTEGRAEILRRLGRFVLAPFTVVNHQAAIRPTVSDSMPVIGQHPEYPQLAILNGLGAKGALWAPLVAQQLAAVLPGRRQVPQQFDWRRWKRTSTT